MHKAVSKLALGTANFGLDYGVTNTSGKISTTVLANILFAAEEAGIEFLDTAQAYGDSEARLGAFLDKHHFKVVTKIGVNSELCFIKDCINRLVEESCKKLNQSRIYGVMLHRPEVLLRDEGKLIIRELLMLKERGIISKIGVSIYSPEILAEITKRLVLDIVQAPFNIFDQQILSSGWSDKLKSAGVEIHSRSVFLQGLLLMQPSSLNRYFCYSWSDQFDAWYKFLQDNDADALQVALNFALEQDWIDKVVVGVDSVAQLRSLLEIEQSSMSLEFPQLGCNDTNLINPSKWKLL